MPPTRALALALLALAGACRREAAPPVRDGGPASAAAAAPFRPADLAAATALDARVARLSLLASEYRAALGLRDAAAVRRATGRLDRELVGAAGALDRALDGISDPRDRAAAAPLAAAARRWPALLRAARGERLSASGAPGTAARSLSAADAEVARALDAYRRSRAGWRIEAAPEEPAAAAFLAARRELERVEAALGEALPGGPAAAAGRIEAGVRAAREAADGVEPARRTAARAWVDAQARALAALAQLGSAPAAEGQRLSLAYQAAKVEALEAAAEWARLTAERLAAR